MRTLILLLFGVLAAVHSVRTALVASAGAEFDSTRQIWPHHPDVIRPQVMLQVGEAAASGRPLDRRTLDLVRTLSAARPLAPEPFLITGALAQQAGDNRRAEQHFAAARARDPRSPAARYLLADLYLRSGRVAAGLTEMTTLGRLVPRSRIQLASALAGYARSGAEIGEIKRVFTTHPELEPAVLSLLAADGANAELVLALATDRPGRGASATAWQERLIRSLVDEGEYLKARSVWSRIAGLPAETASGLFNPEFRDSNAPPPFNWSLGSSGAGVAEAENGGLRVLFFGRESAELASQLMLLPAGSYRFGMRVSGELGTSGGIGWEIACLPGAAPVLRLPLRMTSDRLEGEFSIRAQGCPAQTLKLVAKGEEFAKSADFRLTDLRLARVERQ